MKVKRLFFRCRKEICSLKFNFDAFLLGGMDFIPKFALSSEKEKSPRQN